MRTKAWAFLLLIGIACAVGYALAPRQAIQELWWQVITFGTVGAVFCGTRLHAPVRRRPWHLLLASLTTFALVGLLGISLWAWPPDHVVWALRDLGLVAGVLVLGGATMMLVRARAPGGDPEGAVDGVIVTAAMAAVLWTTVFGPVATHPDTNLAGQARFVLFPLLQVGVTAAALRLLFLGTVRYPSAWLLFGGAILACAANVIAALQHGSPPALVVNLLWIASFLMVGAAILHPSMRHLTDPAARDEVRLSYGRLAVLGVALLLLPASALAGSPPSEGLVTAGAAVVCSGLVLWRLGHVVRQHERSAVLLERRAVREAALSRISGAALASTDRDGFLERTARLVGETLDVTCGIADPPGTARSGPHRMVFPLSGPPESSPALVVDCVPPRCLDDDEVEYVRAVCNVASGAIRRWHAEADLQHQLLHDPLTGLPNRLLFFDRLDHALCGARRDDHPVSLLFVDLDGFKRVNDTLGHQAGDELLIAVGIRLARISRPQDTLARLAGDEFVVVCDRIDGAAATAIGHRIVSELARPFHLQTGPAHVAASVGVASASSGHDAEQLQRDADAAMYRAKRSGGSRVELFEAAIRKPEHAMTLE